MPLPNEPCGSLPRSSKLQSAYADYDAGKISKSDLEALQDEAVQDSLERMEATGQEINCDGEQRWSSFATYPITDTMTGTGLVDTLGDGGQIFALFPDGHYRKLPKLVKGPFKYKNYAAESTKKAVALAKGSGQTGGDCALDAGATLSVGQRGQRLYARTVLRRSRQGVRQGRQNGLCCRRRARFDRFHGRPARVQEGLEQPLDWGRNAASVHRPEGRLACKKDSNNPWTGA